MSSLCLLSDVVLCEWRMERREGEWKPIKRDIPKWALNLSWGRRRETVADDTDTKRRLERGAQVFGGWKAGNNKFAGRD